MPEGSSTSVLNIGEFATPVDTLLKMISGAVGELWLPRQMKRVARAEVEVARIKQEGGLLTLQAAGEKTFGLTVPPSPEYPLVLSPAEQRGLLRMVREQGRYQENIESIVESALPQVTGDAQPEDIEPEWITHFFERCKHATSEDMQQLWGRVLAQEANRPGSLSKRTLEVLGGLEKKDAERFATLCRFTWFVVNDIFPIYLEPGPVYSSLGLFESNTQDLADSGLIDRVDIGLGFPISPERLVHRASYFDHQFLLDCTKLNGRSLSIGVIRFTRAGKELVPVVAPEPVPGFEEKVLQGWQNNGVLVTSVPEKA